VKKSGEKSASVPYSLGGLSYKEFVFIYFCFGL